jgi:hypothetical protein
MAVYVARGGHHFWEGYGWLLLVVLPAGALVGASSAWHETRGGSGAKRP